MKRRLAFALAALVIGLVVRPATAPGGTMNDTWCWSGFMPGSSYGASVDDSATKQDACTGNPGKRTDWHFHGYIKKGGLCYACWDEKDSTCETKPLSEGFTFLWDVPGKTASNKCDVTVADPSKGGQYYGAQTVPTPPVVPKLPDAPLPSDGAVAVKPPDPPPKPPDPPPAPAPIKLAPPPPPTPTDYDGEITKVSPGPYSVNTPIRVEGSAKTTQGGKPRRVTRGDFVIVGPDGKDIQRVHGTRKNGVFYADLSIAVGGNITIRFEPKSIQVGNEVPRTITPGTKVLTLAGCRVEGKLDAPTAGEVLVADAPTALKGHFVDAGGAPIAPTGATIFFLVDVAGKEDKLPAQVDASGVATGTVTVARPQAASEDVRVRLVAEGGPGDICPSANVDAKVTALGVGIEIKPDKQCYTGLPCPVTARFRLPKDAKARANGQAFATAKDMKLTARAAGAPGDLSTTKIGDVDAEWKGKLTPGDAGEITFAVTAVGNNGWKVDDQATFKVLEPIELALKGPLDLGTVQAGTPAYKQCVDLSFAGSRGVLYQQFRLTATKAKGCDSYPTMFDGDAGYALHEADGVVVEILDARTVSICLANVPRCSGESPEPVVLTVQAMSPDFPDQKATLDVKWKVTGRNPLACWWWLIAAVGGSLFVIVVGYGFIKPFRFNVDDQVQLAGKREQLSRAVGRRLRDLPGGRSGWYKSASVGLLENGQATAKVATAIVELHARKGEVILKSRGGLERVSHQTKKLEPVAEAATKDGHCASKNTVYAAGNLFFQIK